MLVAGGTGLYGWRVPFEQSKPGVWAGVILWVFPMLPISFWMNSDVARDRYVILTLAQTLYAYFVEGDIVFVGKRKTFDKRVRVFPAPAPPLRVLPMQQNDID